MRNVITTAAALALATITLAMPAAAHADQLPPVGAKLAPHSVAPCEYEDGSSQSLCSWAADTMGNGIGRSVIIRNGGTERATLRVISHRNAHRLMATGSVSVKVGA